MITFNAKFRATLLCYLSGAVFAVGWWLWIDAHVYSEHVGDTIKIKAQYYIPGMVGTVAMLMINAVSWAQVNGVDQGFFGDGESSRARIWLFVSFAIAFSAFFAAMWIGIAVWLSPKEDKKPVTDYPGLAIILQNALIFGAAVLYRFAKPQVDEFGEPLINN